MSWALGIKVARKNEYIAIRQRSHEEIQVDGFDWDGGSLLIIKAVMWYKSKAIICAIIFAHITVCSIKMSTYIVWTA